MKAVQYHPKYCAEAKVDMDTNGYRPFERWDTSHDLSVIHDDGTRQYIGQYGSADLAQEAGREIEKSGIIPMTARRNRVEAHR